LQVPVHTLSVYTVVFHYVPDSVESLDLIFRYEVLFDNKFENKAIFILDLKPPGQLISPNVRMPSGIFDVDLRI
jgi:hypothetical protein